MAGTLSASVISIGDRVIIYMPMVPETIVAVLVFARIGAIHSVVFGGFAANELAVRIDYASPKALLLTSCEIGPGRVIAYKPLINAAINLATHKPEFFVIHQREQLGAELREGRDFDWRTFQEDVAPACCVSIEGNHPAYIAHLWHNRRTQRRNSLHGGPPLSTAMVDEEHLQRRSQRCVLDCR